MVSLAENNEFAPKEDSMEGNTLLAITPPGSAYGLFMADKLLHKMNKEKEDEAAKAQHDKEFEEMKAQIQALSSALHVNLNQAKPAQVTEKATPVNNAAQQSLPPAATAVKAPEPVLVQATAPAVPANEDNEDSQIQNAIAEKDAEIAALNAQMMSVDQDPAATATEAMQQPVPAAMEAMQQPMEARQQPLSTAMETMQAMEGMQQPVPTAMQAMQQPVPAAATAADKKIEDEIAMKDAEIAALTAQLNGQ